MDMPEIPKGISTRDLLLDFAPNLARQMMAENKSAADLAGTVFTMLVDVSGTQYSYVVKDGTEMTAEEGGLDNPMVMVKIAEEDIHKMIELQSLDMFMGAQGDMDKSKYDALVPLKGRLTAALTNDDGSVMTTDVVFNGADTPHLTLKMKTADSIAVVKKETNPINLFMSGGLQMEGDMGFAMTLQPIFG